MLHPNDKVYAELKQLKLLDPPNPLLKKTLEGVPMSDDLQKEFNVSTRKDLTHDQLIFSCRCSFAQRFRLVPYSVGFLRLV